MTAEERANRASELAWVVSDSCHATLEGDYAGCVTYYSTFYRYLLLIRLM